MTRKVALVMAGGTGGHVFPALATARVLQRRGYDVTWLDYPMQHEVCMEEIAEVARWLRRRLAA